MGWSICAILLINCLFGVTLAGEPNCEKVGLRCNRENTKVQYCAKAGAPPTHVVEECVQPKKCEDEDGRVSCVNPQDNKLHFMCSDEGEFPDPGNCDRTYICKPNETNPSEVCVCPQGNVYPAPGLFCVPGECPRKNITCTEGAYGHFTLKSDDAKTSYYYYCRSSKVVQVFQNVEPQDNAQTFAAVTLDMKNGKNCSPYKTDSATESTPLATPHTSLETASSDSTISEATSTTSNSPLPTTTTVPPEKKPTCTSNGELHPTECDCDYYKCDQNLEPVRRTCADGLRYHERYKKCVFGECDELKCIHRPPKRFTH